MNGERLTEESLIYRNAYNGREHGTQSEVEYPQHGIAGSYDKRTHRQCDDERYEHDEIKKLHNLENLMR